MIEHDYYELFQDDSIDKQLIIETDGGFTIGNEDIFSESMEITESLCSETQLTFGCCEASSFKIKIANIMSPLIGQWLTVSMKLDHRDEKFQIGKYKVYSDTPTADRKWREITAYDVMYDIINSEVSDWYNELLPEADSTVTLKQFRDSFFEYFGIEQEEIELVNDSMIVEQTISPSELSGKDVITAICEINGCFGHITRDGKFRYIYLLQNMDANDLYPSETLFPSDDLFPSEPLTTALSKTGEYITATYEDYKCTSITKLQIRKEENDIGAIAGDGDNCYIIEDNFLVYGKSTDDLANIANKTFTKIADCVYRPFSAEVKGNPCMECGDAVRLATKYELVESYILQRTSRGIQALRDNFITEGVEEYSEKVNSVNKSIIELKGKTNVLTRTVEETKEIITNLDTQVYKDINKLDEDTQADIKKAVEDMGISVDEKLVSYSTTTQMESAITQKANEISSKVSETYTTKVEMSTAVEGAIASANSNTNELLESYSTTTQMESAITQKANEISSKVSETIKIGANNLLLNTDGDEHALGGYPTEKYYEGLAYVTYQNLIDTEYVLSFYAKSTVEGDKIRNYFWSPNTTTSSSPNVGQGTSNADGVTIIPLTTTWQRYYIKYTQTSTNSTKHVIVGRRVAGFGSGEISIMKVQLESGNTPTSWGPSHEDMENKIGQNSSEIKQTAEEISTKVEKNGVISAINQTAESIKISADRINLSGYVTASSLTSSGTTVIDGSRITSGTIQGVTIISKNSSGTYVEIDNGFISGGSSAGESGWIEFGGTWDKNPCVNIRGDNLIIGCSKIGVAVTKDGTEIATGSTTQDIKYTIDMDFTLNNDGKNITLTVEKTQKALMFRKGIFIGQRDL